jgi:hypothetical protein
MRLAMRKFSMFATALSAAATLACGESTAPAPPANARVFLSATEQASPAKAGPAPQSMGGISAESVDSIMVDILAFAAIQSTDTVAYSATLPLNSSASTMRVNFRTLPTTGTDSIEIAKGRLPAGKYDAMRMRFASATITFNTTVTSGGKAFPPGTYPLDMTHGITFAVDVPVDEFAVTNGPAITTVSIQFDVNSSISSLKLNADSTGNFVMNPIFRGTTR